jgi:hypothetical protein
MKWMTETQTFEDELKEVSKLNSVLFARNQELEAQLAKESQAKDGKTPQLPCFDNQLMSEYSGLTIIMFCRVPGSTYGPWHHSWCSRLGCQSLRRPESGSR